MLIHLIDWLYKAFNNYIFEVNPTPKFEGSVRANPHHTVIQKGNEPVKVYIALDGKTFEDTPDNWNKRFETMENRRFYLWEEPVVVVEAKPEEVIVGRNRAERGAVKRSLDEAKRRMKRTVEEAERMKLRSRRPIPTSTAPHIALR